MTMTTPQTLQEWRSLNWIFEYDPPVNTDVRIECSICKNTISEYHRILDLSLCNDCYCSR